MSAYSEEMTTRFAAMEKEQAFRDFVAKFRGAGYMGFVASVPVERATKNGTAFLTFDVAVGTGRKKEGTDKWESMYIQCAWFDYNQEIAKGDVIVVFGSPDLTLLNGKGYPKLSVKHCFVVSASRGGSDAVNRFNDKAKSVGDGAREAGGSDDNCPF